METDATFAANVRAEMARQRRTAKSVAVEIGIDERGFRRRTRGETDWGLAEAAAVARVLGVTLDSLVST